MQNESELLNTQQLAKRLMTKPRTIRSWRSKGIGPTYLAPKGSRSCLYRASDVEAWLSSCATISGAVKPRDE